jgi:hypothetical protein
MMKQDGQGEPRRWRGMLTWLALLPLAALLMGFGGGDDTKEAVIPIPNKSYAVTLTDNQSNKLAGERATWEGKIYFRAKFGNATVSMPFEKLKSIQITKGAAPDRVKVRAQMRSGETLDLTADSTTKFYADTQFGGYEIFLADLATVEFK